MSTCAMSGTQKRDDRGRAVFYFELREANEAKQSCASVSHPLHCRERLR